jgi:hypothetical protein
MDLNHPDFNFSTERQFHCLRHFPFKGYEQLRALAVKFPTNSTEQIIEQLALVGSKFSHTFATEPSEILNRLDRGIIFSRSLENNKTLFQYTFSKDEFPLGIGDSALRSLSKLNETEHARKYKVKRGDYEVWSCNVTELPKSNILSIIAYDQGISFDIITLFPGDYAPAFPRGTSELDEVNKLFWEGHCLLSKNPTETR